MTIGDDDEVDKISASLGEGVLKIDCTKIGCQETSSSCYQYHKYSNTKEVGGWSSAKRGSVINGTSEQHFIL
jgi:hypothetical protein